MINRFIYIFALALSAFSVNAFAQTCQQPSHVWVHGISNNAAYPVGTVIYPTGVVQPNTSANFIFTHASTGNIERLKTTFPAQSNCVIHHEQEVMSTGDWPVGTYNVHVSYTSWENPGVPFQSRYITTFSLYAWSG